MQPANIPPAATGACDFTVVTPSYRQLPWLQLCVASVADQQGVSVEHIVQDACSGSDLEQWVRSETRCKLFVEKDAGMYDAINRGFTKATGQFLAWLNCDEQYLPGALKKVATFFEQNPGVDVLFGDAILVSNEGKLLSYRRTVLPKALHVRLSHLNTLSCATFIRRSVIERGLLLDTNWKTIGDGVWIEAMLRARLPMAVLHEPLALFTMTGTNLGQTQLAREEAKRWRRASTPVLLRVLRELFVMAHRIRKWLAGAYSKRSFSTEIYTLQSPKKRVPQQTENISFRWS